MIGRRALLGLCGLVLTACGEDGGWVGRTWQVVQDCTADSHGQAWGDCIHDHIPVTLIQNPHR